LPFLDEINPILVLLSLRASPNPPAEPFEALKDYFGAYNDHKQIPLDELREKIATLEAQNQYLGDEIEDLKTQIEEAKIQKEREDRERELREQEEKDAKGKKRRKR
jgi:TolA-binding protein